MIKTNKKVISLLLAITILFSLSAFTVMPASAATIAVVNNFEDLKIAINDSSVNTILVMQDIEVSGVLNITRDITITAYQDRTLKAVGTTVNILYIDNPQVDSVAVTFNNIILDGANQARGLYIRHSCTVINNPHIIRGFCQSNTYGGAIYASNDSTIVNGYFEDNQGAGGGAVGGDSTDLKLIGCTFMNNRCGGFGGGAVCVNSGSLNVYGCCFKKNTVEGGSGAAIKTKGVISCNIQDSVFEENIGDSYAVIVYSSQQQIQIVNSTFIGNSGAFTIPSTSQVLIKDSEFINNSTSAAGGAVNITGDTEIRNCKFEGNVSTAGYGGAIRVTNNLEIYNTSFINNTATAGGAIFSFYREKIYVDEDCIFSGNYAGAGGYFMSSAKDIELHNQQIKATAFSFPFSYAYNNYDINYSSGTKYVE